MSKPVMQALACGVFLAVCAADIAAHPRPRVVGDGSVLATIPQEAAYCAGQPGCNGGYPEAALKHNPAADRHRASSAPVGAGVGHCGMGLTSPGRQRDA
ncbi:hypothetical protein, partial [uncultured Lamprocystis sp.]